MDANIESLSKALVAMSRQLSFVAELLLVSLRLQLEVSLSFLDEIDFIFLVVLLLVLSPLLLPLLVLLILSLLRSFFFLFIAIIALRSVSLFFF